MTFRLCLKCLKDGAHHPDEEVTAIVEGTACDAGQICAAKDFLRRYKQIQYNEFQPVLQVKEVVWTGAIRFGTPMKHWIVTDDEDGGTSMVMVASTRTDSIYKHFFKTWGQSGKDVKLTKKRRFRLLDYTTSVTSKGSLFSEPIPVIHAEIIRCEPRSNFKKKLNAFAKNNGVGEGDVSDEY